MKVLVVEDDPDSLALLEAALGGSGYCVLSARDGVAALAAARADPPDLIVSDILMPEMDGFALCRALKADPELGRIPLVFYTATYVDPRDEELGLALGAARFLVKPMEPVHLLSALEAVLRASGEGRGDGGGHPGERLDELHAERLGAKLDKKVRELEHERRALAEKEAWLSSVIRAAPSAIVCLDRGGRPAGVNPEAERVLGTEWLGRLEREGGEALFPGAGSPFRRALAGEAVRGCELELRGAEGTRTVVWNLERIEGAGGDVLGVVAVGQDVTAARTAERERAALEGQLARAQRLEAVGRLAGGVAHDFNNLLTPILACAEMIGRDEAAGGRSRDRARHIVDAAVRAGEITRQFLAFSRRQVLEVRNLDLNEVVSGFQRLLRQLVREDVSIDLELAPGLAPVRGDQSQLEQILMNLTLNAADAMPAGGPIRIETAEALVEDGAFPHVAAGRYAVLTVRDRGHGMAPDVLGRVFEPFFTTKEKGKGTGLGLATVYGIVRQHGGHVTAQSAPGEGTIFRVYLPEAPGEAQPAPTRGVEAVPSGGGEAVLVVDDEDLVRAVMVDVLVQAGYRACGAAEPQAALEAFEAAGRRLDLLLCEVVLPGEGGPELYRRLRAEQPALKVLYTSGHAADAGALSGALAFGAPFLHKPFAPEALLRAVREALEAPGRV